MKLRTELQILKDISCLIFVISLSAFPPLLIWAIHGLQSKLIAERMIPDVFFLLNGLITVASFLMMLELYNRGIAVSKRMFVVIGAIILLNPFVVMAFGFSPWPNVIITWGYMIFGRIYHLMLTKRRK